MSAGQVEAMRGDVEAWGEPAVKPERGGADGMALVPDDERAAARAGVHQGRRRPPLSTPKIRPPALTGETQPS